jgi:hypothetical protein
VRSPWLGVVSICGALVCTPLLWRPVVARLAPPASAAPSYLPAVLEPRDRYPFDAAPIGDLQAMKPDYVTIGDSMAGRVDPADFMEVSGQSVAPILFNATGTAHWFLVFKNYVVASGIKPTRVIVFFRDTNLTDPMWRLPQGDDGGLDRVARDREDELNDVVALHTQGAWYRVHALVDRLYGIERTRRWLDSGLSSWLSRVAVGRLGRRAFVDQMNGMFALDQLRPLAAADIDAAEAHDMDFAGTVGASLLPHFLRMADEQHLRLCFVRVLRRPEGGRPPDEPAALARYVKDLRQYLEGHGAAFIDDRDDPEMAKLPYGDGDHIAAEGRRRYAELFWAKLQKLPR